MSLYSMAGCELRSRVTGCVGWVGWADLEAPQDWQRQKDTREPASFTSRVSALLHMLQMT